MYNSFRNSSLTICILGALGGGALLCAFFYLATVSFDFSCKSFDGEAPTNILEGGKRQIQYSIKRTSPSPNDLGERTKIFVPDFKRVNKKTIRVLYNKSYLPCSNAAYSVLESFDRKRFPDPRSLGERVAFGRLDNAGMATLPKMLLSNPGRWLQIEVGRGSYYLMQIKDASNDGACLQIVVPDIGVLSVELVCNRGLSAELTQFEIFQSKLTAFPVPVNGDVQRHEGEPILIDDVFGGLLWVSPIQSNLCKANLPTITFAAINGLQYRIVFSSESNSLFSLGAPTVVPPSQIQMTILRRKCLTVLVQPAPLIDGVCYFVADTSDGNKSFEDLLRGGLHLYSPHPMINGRCDIPSERKEGYFFIYAKGPGWRAGPARVFLKNGDCEINPFNLNQDLVASFKVNVSLRGKGLDPSDDSVAIFWLDPDSKTLNSFPECDPSNAIGEVARFKGGFFVNNLYPLNRIVVVFCYLTGDSFSFRFNGESIVSVSFERKRSKLLFEGLDFVSSNVSILGVSGDVSPLGHEGRIVIWRAVEFLGEVATWVAFKEKLVFSEHDLKAALNSSKWNLPSGHNVTYKVSMLGPHGSVTSRVFLHD